MLIIWAQVKISVQKFHNITANFIQIQKMYTEHGRTCVQICIKLIFIKKKGLFLAFSEDIYTILLEKNWKKIV